MASNLMKRGEKCFGLDLKRVNVRIYPNGAGTPRWETEGGIAVVGGVAWTATGKFTITLDASYYKFRDGQATYRDERDNVDLYAQLGVVSNEGTSNPITVVVKLKTGTANTDVATGSGANDRCIYVNLEFEDVAA
jgi:hypothetical protein